MSLPRLALAVIGDEIGPSLDEMISFCAEHEVRRLDMRMSASGVSAADVVNRAKVSDLIRIFGFLGEEKHSGRIARAIEKRRVNEPFQTTRDLANLIETVNPRKAKDKIHPATRVFQALRIYVNDELGELAQALFAASFSVGLSSRSPAMGLSWPVMVAPWCISNAL